MKVRTVSVLLVGFALVASALLLYFFNPTQVGFYPKCMFHAWTGLDCPGCGGLRAAHQLLHGHFAAAFRFNPLLICLLPLALVYGSWYFLARLQSKPEPRILESPRVAWTLAIAVIAFGVLRNVIR